MGKALVAHHYWARVGGGELVVAAVAVSLERMGKDPVLVSPFYFDPAKYTEWFGIDLTRYEVVRGRFKLNMFGLYSRLITWMPVKDALKSYRPEVVFIDSSNYAPLIKDRNRGFKLIEYIHFPLEAYQTMQDPAVMERYSRFPMNLYWWGYMKLMKRYIRPDPFESADLVLANSSWTADVVRQTYGEVPYVLNPPIPPNMEVVSFPRRFEERARQVTMLGRFSEEKRYHWVISELFPLLLKDVPDARLRIFGGIGGRTSRSYFERLSRMVSRLSLEGKVELIPNAPRSAINESMDSSRAFLHAMINEHWGIAVAEAMARGIPVVAHRSGGTWSDILARGAYGMGFESAEEASGALAKLLTDEEEWKRYSAPQRMMDFTIDKFHARFSECVDKIRR
ncbi:Glycosyltransferase [Conexivisphaera calida]|uniref:Glycosyltransferase n=2 Tax=Conexivisphaera calida TaxID=1874277 RepID=A0A4P2VDX3_9ARCH|nr:Glycosyltransferase [Conexivisphaera calida]